MKVPFIIYADTKYLLEKISKCYSIPEKWSTTKINKYTDCDYLFFTHFSFDTTKSKHNYYRGKNCMKNFCRDLKTRKK